MWVIALSILLEFAGLIPAIRWHLRRRMNSKICTECWNGYRENLFEHKGWHEGGRRLPSKMKRRGEFAPRNRYDAFICLLRALAWPATLLAYSTAKLAVFVAKSLMDLVLKVSPLTELELKRINEEYEESIRSRQQDIEKITSEIVKVEPKIVPNEYLPMESLEEVRNFFRELFLTLAEECPNNCLHPYHIHPWGVENDS